jgi:O-antigen ligase
LLLAFFLRRVWIAALAPVIIVAGIAAFLPNVSITPRVNAQLQAAADQGQISAFAPGSDSSSVEHADNIKNDIVADLQHPFGMGTGAATIRYGATNATGESAVLGLFGELGIVGGALYLALFLLTIWQGYRALGLSRAASLEDVLPLVAFVGGLALIPITLTSDVWGDLSVTFPFWWAAGASATICAQRARRTKRAPAPARVARWTRPIAG